MIEIKDMTDDMLVLKKTMIKRMPNTDEQYYNSLCEEIKKRNLNESEIIKSLLQQ